MLTSQAVSPFSPSPVALSPVSHSASSSFWSLFFYMKSWFSLSDQRLKKASYREVLIAENLFCANIVLPSSFPALVTAVAVGQVGCQMGEFLWPALPPSSPTSTTPHPALVPHPWILQPPPSDLAPVHPPHPWTENVNVIYQTLKHLDIFKVRQDLLEYLRFPSAIKIPSSSVPSFSSP